MVLKSESRNKKIFQFQSPPTIYSNKFMLKYGRHFKESFLKVADFMLEKKVNISTDFLYLGIALVTMYSSLEKIGAKVNVKQVYLDVKKQLEAK